MRLTESYQKLKQSIPYLSHEPPLQQAPPLELLEPELADEPEEVSLLLSFEREVPAPEPELP